MTVELIAYLLSMAAVYFFAKYRKSEPFLWAVVYFLIAWVVEDFYLGSLAVAYPILALAIVGICEVLIRQGKDPFSASSIRSAALGTLRVLGLAPKSALQNATEHKLSREAIKLAELENWHQLESYLSGLDAESRHTVFEGISEGSVRPVFLDKWLEDQPKSQFAAIASGFNYVSIGWEARGSTTADLVTQEGWELFFTCLTAAEGEFKRAIDISDTSHSAYIGLIRISMGAGIGAESLWKYFARGVVLAPNNYHLQCAMMHACAPKWGGEAGDMFNIAIQANKDAPAESASVASLAVAHVEHWLSNAMMGDEEDAELYFLQKTVKEDLQSLYGSMKEWQIDSFVHIEALNVLAFCLDKADMVIECRDIITTINKQFVSYPWCYSNDAFLANFDEAYAVDYVVNKHGLH